jgi:hypothetical protein
MSGKISGFLREYVLFFSTIITIVGLFVFILGITGLWYQALWEQLGISEYINWNIYLLIIGFIVLITGVYYLYVYLKNRKFILDELKTNKRSELLKKHNELKNAVKHMPSKFKNMLKDKEDELKIR